MNRPVVKSLFLPVFLLILLISVLISGCAGVFPSPNSGGKDAGVKNAESDISTTPPNEKNPRNIPGNTSGNTSNNTSSPLPTRATRETPTTQEPSKSYPIRVVDDFGFEVVINKTPERIVSLAPSNTEILFALGLGDKIVGVTDYDNYPPEALKKPKVGGFSTVNIEKVLSLNPDLVVAAYGNGAETVETLRGYGITVIALNPRNLTDVMRNIEMLGKITGTGENATKLVEMMKQKIREVEEATANNSRRPKVAHILWHDPIWVSGGETFIDELIRIAGGTNAFGDMEGWKIVSIEDLLARNPDIIIVNSGTGMGGKNNILYNWAMRELKDVNAVREGRVYVIDSDIISRPSYRLVYALEEIAKIIREYNST